MIKNRNGFSVGDQTSVDTWTSQCSILLTGITTTNGSISAIGSLEGGYITASSGNISSLSGNIQMELLEATMDHFKISLALG